MQEREQQQDTPENNKPASNESGESTPIYLTGDSTLQTPDEDRRDSAIDAQKDQQISVSNDDLRENDADPFAGSDRAGTAERKDNNNS